MPLLIQENFTAKLGEMLKNGDLDLIILSLPYSEPGIETCAVYDEPFRVVMPAQHAWAKKTRIPVADLCRENLLLLSRGNCFPISAADLRRRRPRHRRQHAARTRRQFAGNHTHMVARRRHYGAAVERGRRQDHGKQAHAVRPFAPPSPSRRVALAWRRSFPLRRSRGRAQAVLACKLPGDDACGRGEAGG